MIEKASNVPATGVAMTAIGVAVIRARESERADRLYEDSFAQGFVDAARAGFDDDRWDQLTALADQFYEGRTLGVRMAEDRVREAFAAGIRQFVLLGAGLDTRAFRMGFAPETVVYEVDLPEMFAFKEPELARVGAEPTCGRRVVVADLREDWHKALLDSGFHPDLPTFWVDEGTLGILNQEWNQRVVRVLTELSSSGSLFGASRYIVAPDNPAYRELRRMAADPAAPDWGKAPAVHDIDVEAWLNELGWDTEFRSWNSMVAPLGRKAARVDPDVGSIVAVRR